MMRYVLLIITLVGTVVSAEAINVDDMARTIAKNSPNIAATGYSDRIAAAQLLAENRLDDPEVEVEQLWGNSEIGHKFAAGVSQTFQMPNVYRARREAAEAMTQGADYLGQEQYLAAAWQAKQAILQYIHAGRCIRGLEKICENFDSLSTLYASARMRGEYTVLDINKLKIERVGLEQRIASYKADQLDAINKLQAISPGTDRKELVGTLETLKEFPMEPLLPLDSIKAYALRKDPTLLYAGTRDESREAMLKLQRTGRMPQVTLGYKYNHENGMNFNGINLGVTLPVYSRKKSEVAISIEQQESAAQTTVTEASIISEIDAAWNQAQFMRKQYETLAPVINDPNVRTMLEKARDARTITLIEYIQEINYYAEAEMTLYDTQYALAQALAALNKYRLLD